MKPRTDSTAAPAGSKRSPAAAEPNAWERLLIAWHVAFWLMLASAGAYTAFSTRLSSNGRVLAAGLLFVLGITYAAGVMWRGVARRGVANVAYVVVAIVIVGAACWIDSTYLMLLFIAFPQVWMFTPTLVWGMGGTVALTAAAIIGLVLNTGRDQVLWRDFLPQLVISLLFSLLLGVWIYKLIEQSLSRADLIAELQHTRNELAEAHHAHGVLAERQRMAREIHDTLAQGFISIVTLSQAGQARLAKLPSNPGLPAEEWSGAELARLQAIEEVARENLAEARALVAAFAPVDLDGVALPEAVQQLADRFTERTGTAVVVEISGSSRGLKRAQEVVLLRAVQEALTNVRRHAGAAAVHIRLVYENARATVEIIDDGVGFSPTQGAGFGLPGMRDRVHAAGGLVAVDSELGRGTRVVVQVPAAAHAAPAEADVPPAAAQETTAERGNR
ncbi:MAG: hypothetical protein CSA58_03300 [Micrococcales bacterium]|nr:MAG: hypothetical protein CSA58_03300 [Micrococcales bacterium]